jgi:hypothetical protein
MQDLIKLAIIPAASLALPLAVQAGAPTGDQGISYDYLEAAWVFGDDLDVDGSDLGVDERFDVDGFFFKGSAEVAPGVFIYASNLTLDMEVDNDFSGAPRDFDLGLDNQSLGAGYHMPLMTGPSPLDVWGAVSYERLDTVGQPANGYGVSAGARWMPIQGLELNAFGGWRDFGEVGGILDASPGTDAEIDGWSYGVGALYHVTPKLAVTGNWTRYDLEADIDSGGSDAQADLEVDAFMVGGRWYY